MGKRNIEITVSGEDIETPFSGPGKRSPIWGNGFHF